ncbi:MarR family winged helix-turn-helix transcriptional regulator [Pseudonocardia dioxanivorans]|uniref:MarR family winged helix-turn-helix transcriptional regulator n=1 Tax=Pseudonocardia dioxanivorans TaxID=240495 RepID=UPI001F157FC6|nr:MarR family transcriptional regulator [Pseudonocardia dioxanivorans]
MPDIELAAALHRLARVAIDAELPVLRAHDLEMWDYVVMCGLRDGPTRTQASLADAVGRDRTRLIPILDRLEARGLVTRTPDPDDRRNRIVGLTDAGTSLARSVATGIREVEDTDVLSPLDRRERAALRSLLGKLLGA